MFTSNVKCVFSGIMTMMWLLVPDGLISCDFYIQESLEFTQICVNNKNILRAESLQAVTHCL